MMAGSMMAWLDMVTAPTRETNSSSQGTVAARQTVSRFITALTRQISYRTVRGNVQNGPLW